MFPLEVPEGKIFPRPQTSTERGISSFHIPCLFLSSFTSPAWFQYLFQNWGGNQTENVSRFLLKKKILVINLLGMSVETGPNSRADGLFTRFTLWPFFTSLIRSSKPDEVTSRNIKQEISEACWTEALLSSWANVTFTSSPFMPDFPPGWSAPSWRRW